MDTELPDKVQSKTACVACFESIIAGAKICPHCHSAQTPHRWHVISQSLKWVGGIVTIISLVIGGVTLSRFYLDWQEQRDTISELVEAADWLSKTKDYSQAWKMFEQANELNPSSPLVRDGRFRLAKIWVRNWGGGNKVDKSKEAVTLDAISETLYRDLPNASVDDEASILAHVAYVQFLRRFHNLAVFVDAESLLEKALEKSPDNIYANTFYARFITTYGQKEAPVTAETIRQVETLFQKALTYAKKDDKSFVRSHQFSSLHSFTQHGEHERREAALSALIKASADVMQSGEANPPKYIKNYILYGYGRGKAELVEVLVSTLPAKEQLAVFEWALEDFNGNSDDLINQFSYIKARLNEAMNNKDAALERYQSLLATETNKELQQLVDQSIQRLTGKLPVRIRKRNFIDDPVNEKNRRSFHIDSLKNFDPELSSENFNQAITYFKSKTKSSPEDLQSLLTLITAQINRVRESLRMGDETEKMNAYTSGFNAWHHDNIRNSLISLSLLHSSILNSQKQFEASIAQLTDVLKIIKKLDENWRPIQGKIEYNLARSYHMLARSYLNEGGMTLRNQNKRDTEQSMLYLINTVNHGAIEHKHVSWDEIKAAEFYLLERDERYQKLIRGR